VTLAVIVTVEELTHKHVLADSEELKRVQAAEGVVDLQTDRFVLDVVISPA
jgi:hypothetical protein